VIFVLVVTQWYGECIDVPHPLVINLIMDGEDILEEFSDEEEIDACIATPCRHKVHFYTLEKKRQIVNEAFSAPRMVRLLPVNGLCSLHRFANGGSRCSRMQCFRHIHTPAQWRSVQLLNHKLVKTRNEGRPTMTPNDLLQQLLPYIEGLRERGNAVSTTTVTLE
jgi:hypothetical protein